MASSRAASSTRPRWRSMARAASARKLVELLRRRAPAARPPRRRRRSRAAWRARSPSWAARPRRAGPAPRGSCAAAARRRRPARGRTFSSCSSSEAQQLLHLVQGDALRGRGGRAARAGPGRGQLLHAPPAVGERGHVGAGSKARSMPTSTVARGTPASYQARARAKSRGERMWSTPRRARRCASMAST